MSKRKGKFQHLIELLPQIVFETDIQGNLTYINPSAYALFGYTEADFKKGFNVLTAIAPEDRPLAAENFRHLLNRQEIKRHEYTAIDKKGRTFPIIIYSSLIEEQGRVTGTRGIIVDVSDIKQTEEARQINESKFHAIYDQALHLAGILDLDGTMTDANATARRFIGGDESQYIGKPFWETPWWTHSPQTQEKLRLCIERAARGEFIQFETTHFNAHGELRHIDFTIKPVFDNQGKVFCLIPEGRDISIRKKAEQDREKLQNQLLLAQKLESIGRLAGGIAHDFNNMIGAIIGFAELEIKTRKEQPERDYINQILSIATRSADLTRQLLTFARQQPINPVPLDLNDTVEGHLDMLRRLMGEEVNLDWHPGKNLWPVCMDPNQVHQVLTNLCLNARDAVSEQGQIQLETINYSCESPQTISTGTADAGQYVLLTVSDNGSGMDELTRTHLFEPFYTTKRAGKGTGLGLATVYGIISQNKGFIDLQTEVGRGTSFRIFLPVHHGADPLLSEQAQTAEPLLGKGETILLVEDEPAILEMGRTMLEFLGYSPLTAGGPMDALALMESQNQEIALLITDVIMPGMNGKELAQAICSMRPGTPCLFMSGYPAEVIASRGSIETGVEFIQKPFTLPDFSQKIHSLLKLKP